jgi:isopentenyl phosphate kinase
MPKKQVLIVKLGGSIVTLKHLGRPAIRRTHVSKIASILKKQYDPLKHALILIHGAGSFGHLHAHQYGLSQGTKDQSQKTFRAIENQSLDARLNAELTTLFVTTGLPVVGLPTRTIAKNEAGKLSSLNIDSIESTLSVGAIPLLHGDMVFDTTWGLSVCSGDVLVPELARRFSADSVFFASDVDGIYTADPHQYSNATLIQKTTLEELSLGTIQMGKSHNIDVTGGLSKKFSLFYKMPSLEEIRLFNGLVPKNFSFIFDQRKFFGTTIIVKK